MHVTPAMTSSDLDAAHLQALPRDLCRTLNQEAKIHAPLGEDPGGVVAKGVPVVLGEMALTGATHAGGVMLGHRIIETVKAFWERRALIQRERQRENGQKFVMHREYVVWRTSTLPLRRLASPAEIRYE